jgi:hypothetical protein
MARLPFPLFFLKRARLSKSVATVDFRMRLDTPIWVYDIDLPTLLLSSPVTRGSFVRVGEIGRSAQGKLCNLLRSDTPNEEYTAAPTEEEPKVQENLEVSDPAAKSEIRHFEDYADSGIISKSSSRLIQLQIRGFSAQGIICGPKTFRHF